jgi:hypothetical protein
VRRYDGWVSDERALGEIKRLTRLNRVVFRMHARERMKIRGAVVGDVLNALVSATSARWQHEQETWRVDGGVDCDGDDLTVIVDLEADVIVVTIF